MPATGFHGLPKNFVVESFITSLPSVSQCALSQGENHGSVEYFCIDCWDLLCATCYQGHTKFVKVAQSHVIKKITEVNQTDVELHNRKKSFTCSQHKNQEVVLYCTECEQVACTVCCVVSHVEHMKKCVSIEEIDKTFLARIKERLDNTKQCLTDYENMIKETEKSIEDVIKEQTKYNADVKKTLDNTKFQITDAYNKIMLDVEECQKNAFDVIDDQVKVKKESAEKLVIETKYKHSSLQAVVELFEKQISPLSTPINRAAFLKNCDTGTTLLADIHIEKYQTADDHLKDLAAWKKCTQTWLRRLLKSLNGAKNMPRLHKFIPTNSNGYVNFSVL